MVKHFLVNLQGKLDCSSMIANNRLRIQKMIHCSPKIQFDIWLNSVCCELFESFKSITYRSEPITWQQRPCEPISAFVCVIAFLVPSINIKCNSWKYSLWFHSSNEDLEIIIFVVEEKSHAILIGRHFSFAHLEDMSVPVRNRSRFEIEREIKIHSIILIRALRTCQKRRPE